MFKYDIVVKLSTACTISFKEQTMNASTFQYNTMSNCQQNTKKIKFVVNETHNVHYVNIDSTNKHTVYLYFFFTSPQ